jgi:hypothetical protein
VPARGRAGLPPLARGRRDHQRQRDSGMIDHTTCSLRTRPQPPELSGEQRLR